MIISCKCGKYEFEVSKSDIPNEGRNVQCGVCNETWFQTPYEKKNFKNLNKSHYIANFFLLIIVIISFIGIMETFKNELLTFFPNIDQYFNFIEILKKQIILSIKKLPFSFGI